MKLMIGIDLGGTNIKAGVVNDQGEILYKDRIKTNPSRGQLEIIRDMGLLARRVIAASGLDASAVAAIGIGSPGTPDNQAGTVVFAGNLPFRKETFDLVFLRLAPLGEHGMPNVQAAFQLL